jgi:uncharacterized phiE125 gp8 family phage protein
VYVLDTPGPVPISLSVGKAHLKVETKVDDALITNLLHMVTSYAEASTGRDYRANTWVLYQDDFGADTGGRILIRKCPIDSITTVVYTVDGSLTEIASSVWYLKKSRQWSEILLKEDQEWPDDLDDIEAGIVITFVTEADRHVERAKTGMLKHLAHLYQNRGDCDVVDAAEKSGANTIYRGPGMKIVRV